MEEQEKNSTFEISLRDLWQILVRCWWIMLAAAVVLAGATYVFLRVTHKDAYTAKAGIWVMREKTQSITQTSDVSIANNIINDVVRVTETTDVLDAVRAATGTDRTNAQIRSMLRVSSVGNSADETSHVVDLQVTAPTPEEAYALVQAIMVETCNKINNDLFDGETYTKPFDKVTQPTAPSNPISLTRVLLVGLIGAVLVYGVFFVLHILDDKINSAEDVDRRLGISVLGEIPNANDALRRRKYGGYYYASYAAHAKIPAAGESGENGENGEGETK